MERLYTNSKMVQFEHTWIIEPAAFSVPCPSCEVWTGDLQWLLNYCTAAGREVWLDGACRSCTGPYLLLLSKPRRDAIVSVYEEGKGRRVHLSEGAYKFDPCMKVLLDVLDRNTAQAKRRKIVTQIQFYENCDGFERVEAKTDTKPKSKP